MEGIKRHGLASPEKRKGLYRSWEHMKQRCYNPKHRSYKNYGARGIHVCEEWQNSSVLFINWAHKNGYKEGLRLDRIDNDGNYNPENCRWVTVAQNNRNKRLTKLVPEDIKNMRLLALKGASRSDIASRYEISPSHAHGIIVGELWSDIYPDYISKKKDRKESTQSGIYICSLEKTYKAFQAQKIKLTHARNKVWPVGTKVKCKITGIEGFVEDKSKWADKLFVSNGIGHCLWYDLEKI